MTPPTVNMNLAKCTCDYRIGFAAKGTHFAGCPGIPINSPLHVERSFTCTVVLGECLCLKTPRASGHRASCPARPIKVSCSISGKTWEESEVEDIDPIPDLWGANCNMRAIARARWALVKALVLGKRGVDGFEPPPQSFGLMVQRDAVYAALCEMARADSVAQGAFREALAALDAADVAYSAMTPVGSRAADMLAAYVGHLIEQVGVL